MVVSKNIKKLRKFYLFESYTEFLNKHDTVLFLNTNSQHVRMLLQPLGLSITVKACKNTLLKKKYQNYNFFNNVLTGEICLLGIDYSCITITECKKLYTLLEKEDILVLGGLYRQLNNKSVFYLPVDSSILEYHNNPNNFYQGLVGATTVPVVFGSVQKLYQFFLYSYLFFSNNFYGVYAKCYAISEWYKNRQI